MSYEILDDKLRIRVEQKRLINGKILNQKELCDLAADVFKDFDIRKHYVPLTFIPDFDSIDVDWIRIKMEDYGLKASDLSKQLAINKGDLSSFLKGKKPIPKSMKVKVFYYFKVFEINQDFRDYING